MRAAQRNVLLAGALALAAVLAVPPWGYVSRTDIPEETIHFAENIQGDRNSSRWRPLFLRFSPLFAAPLRSEREDLYVVVIDRGLLALEACAVLAGVAVAFVLAGQPWQRRSVVGPVEPADLAHACHSRAVGQAISR